MQDFLNAFQYISDHIHVAGWVFLISCAIKLTSRANKFLNKLEGAGETIDKMATNHLPHLEQGMNSLTTELRGLRQDIIAIVLNK